MFKPFRLIFLMALAFVAGVLFERQDAAEKCASAGGTLSAGLRRGAS